MFKTQIPAALYTAAETRQLDATAIETYGIPGEVLMGRAGEAAFALLQSRWPAASTVAVVCGGGNNGGDGYVLALAAQQAGLGVTVLAQVPVDALRGDALTYAQRALDAGIDVVPAAGGAEDLVDADVIVDALLGTGLAGEVRQDYALLIEAMNAAPAAILAIDVPSGLNADTGAPLGAAVRADATITFIGAKQGLLTGSGVDLCGQVYFAGLDVPAEVYAEVPARCRCWQATDLDGALPRRQRDGHKGRYGHVLVIGGDEGFAGAVVMAAQAAARCGAGLVSVATRSANVPVVLARQPEIMAQGVESVADLQPLLERASVVVVGPGLGRGPWGQSMLRAALDAGLPRVMDADALNLVADSDWRRSDVVQVMTPHPGEAGRLLGATAAAVNQDRFAAVAAVQQQYGGTVLLKGAGTLVASGADSALALLRAGNPGMASGGMGDVLSGVIGALLAQQLPAHEAAIYGGLVHAVAADICAGEDGERGLLATDLLPVLRRLLNGVRGNRTGTGYSKQS